MAVGSGFLQQALVVEGAGPGGIVTGIDFVGGQMYAVTDRGGLYEVSLSPQFIGGQFFFSSNNLATYVRSSAIDLMTADNGGPIRFAGLTAGPQNAENGRYADMLFGISDTGTLYAFNTAGELQPVFVNDSSSAETGLFGVNGLAFSTLDRNLWTVTGNRNNDEGHGYNGPGTSYEPFDRSRLDVAGSGGSSFYFGNDRSTNVGGNQSFSNTGFIRNYDFPGGAYGSLVSREFSLSGYSSADKPVLYFNYFLESEDTDYDPNTNPITPTRDSFRVFVGGDDGEWTLVGTNNTFQDALRLDEFDIGQNDASCLYPAFAGEPCVQKVFDNTGTWRQARVSLSNFAGMDNLRLRFDFSTAGSMNLGDSDDGRQRTARHRGSGAARWPVLPARLHQPSRVRLWATPSSHPTARRLTTAMASPSTTVPGVSLASSLTAMGASHTTLPRWRDGSCGTATVSR